MSRPIDKTGRGWLISLLRDEPRAFIAWAGGDDPTRSMIDPLLAQLAGAKFKQIAVCAEGRARFELDWSLRNRSKKLAAVDITFDGEMLDLTVPPSEQELTRSRAS